MIRPATPDDIAAMAAVWLASALTAYADIFPADAPAPTQESLSAALDNGVPTFVYADGDAIVGLVQVDGDLLSHLYVRPSHWGRGIGRALHDTAVAHGGTRLWVLRQNAHARAMYERWGWCENGKVQPVYEPAGIEDVGYDLRGVDLSSISQA